MTKLEENFNKATNLLLSIGSICLITSVSALLIMSNLGALQFETASVAIAMIAAFGLALVVASSFLWRKLLKYGTSETRLFYLWNRDKGQLD